MYQRLRLILLLVSFLISSNVLARSLVSNKAGDVRFNISSREINRINLQDEQIQEVIGDISKYNMITCQQKKNLFINLRQKNCSEQKITLIMTSGRVQDIVLVPKDITGQTITLRFGKSGSTRSDTTRSEVTKMLRAMKAGNCDNYYVIDVDELITSKKALFEVRKRKLYRRGDFTGVVLEVTNNSEEAMQISPEDFLASFKGVVASGTSCRVIAQGQTIRVFVITYRGEHV